MEERKFLHDISSPITSLLLDLENAQQLLTAPVLIPNDLKDCRELINNCLEQVTRSIELIRTRREILINSGAT